MALQSENGTVDQAVQELESVVKDELASVAQIIVAMTKTLKALRLYLPNNPVLIGFINELDKRMAVHLARYGELSLDVEPFDLRYQGARVYENKDPRESIACRLYVDGIRTIFFDRGLQGAELMAFLGIIGFDQPGSDDDVVTQLWERNLLHVGYLTQEDFSAVALEDDQADPNRQREALERIHRALSEQQPPPPRMIPKHLLMLTGEEEKWLRTALEAEGRCSGLEDVVDILSAILAGVQDSELFADFAGIMGKLTLNMLLAGDIGHALRLVRFLNRLQKHDAALPERRQLLADALAGILTDATVQVLQEELDGGEAVRYAELKELLLILGIPSLGAICELLGRVEKLKVRKLIVEVLVELGRNDPAMFAPFLKDPRWYLVRNLVLILSLIGTPAALQMIVGLISHKEPRVRREVLAFLERCSDSKAKSYIVKYLRDDTSALRIRALQILAREKLPFALKPVLALATAEDFQLRPLAEKKEIYQALGELGAEQMIPMFRELLMKKYWFQKASEKEAATLAVAGLARINSKASLMLLQEARKHKKNVEVRGILEQALAAMAAKGQRSA